MAKMPADKPGSVWWRDGVLYQIYPRSYLDTNGDGVGDLNGIRARLDHLEWLGVDGIWLNPTMAGPNDDWGYDVADYCSVHPELGTLDDLEALVADAAQREIRILLDLVPNHSSDRHAWFVDARSSRDSKYRDYYVWADPKTDGSPPNNWRNIFDPRRPAWTFDEVSGQYYLNQFLPSQPDLNWWNPAVRDEFDRIFDFWYDRGIAGFRIDVCHAIVKDAHLRDNPPTTADDHWYAQMHGLRQIYNASRPEVHDLLRHWRSLAATRDPERILVGETYVLDPEGFASFYGDGDELNLAFNFMLLHSEFEPASLAAAVAHSEQLLPASTWPTWTGGNHDNHRWATRWCGNDPYKARAAMVMLLTLRGTPFLYYGDEIAMPDTDVPLERILDPVGHYHGPRLGRDAERTPMHWNAGPGGGFSGAGVEPWLPYGDFTACNVADQRNDPDSMLTLTRDLIALRRATPALRSGAYTQVTDGSSGLWSFRRGADMLVALNLCGEPHRVEVSGEIAIGTDRRRDGEAVSGSLVLAPWEAAIVRTA
jgi:alpha-glucosidase